MNNSTATKNSVTLCAFLIFCIFVFAFELFSHKTAQTRIREHALIISDALWNVNIQGAAEYLKLAAAASDYTSFMVLDESGEILQALTTRPPTTVENFFHRIFLTPEVNLAAKVDHHGKNIGSIQAVWLPSTLSTHIYFLFVISLITAILHLYLRVREDKKILEQRVRARTAELAQSNRSLLQEMHQKKKRTAYLRKSEEEYRRLYRKSKSTEEVYRSLIDSSADAILIYDLNSQVEYLSAEFSALFGWQLAEVRGKQLDFINPPEAEAVEAVLAEIKGQGRSCQAYETRGITQGGTVLDISISGSRFNDHTGQPAGLMLVVRDIGYRKKMEKQLQRAERMEAIGTLAGGIAHDFNNLLMGIQGNTSLLLLKSMPPQKVKLEAIETYVNRGQELTGQLLGFARGGKYETKPTNLNQLVQAENRLISRTRKDITIHEEYEPDIWPVEVDRGQIRQVLLNLYVNASQAMPTGGDLIVFTRNVHLDDMLTSNYDEVKAGRYVVISVTDTGHGMDKQTEARIFDPFFTTKEIGRGTGLGLASTYGIIKNHHGFIDVNSALDDGTTFTLYLPASEKAIIEDHSVNAYTLVEGQGTILLVDDEPMILEVGKEMLQTIGYQVLTANSGEQACEHYMSGEHHISLVVLDMIMPGMDGGTVFDRLKSFDPEVKVILSSGYSLNEKASDIIARGCSGFLQKPFDINALSVKIKEILAGNTSMD